MFLCWRCMVAMVSDCAGFVWRMSSYDAIGRIFLTQGCCFELWTTQGGSMRAHDGTLALLTIFAWLVGCGLSGPPTPPPESPLSLPEKIFNKIGENAKLIMVLLKYQKIWNQQIICQHNKCYSPVSGMKKSVIKGEPEMSQNVVRQALPSSFAFWDLLFRSWQHVRAAEDQQSDEKPHRGHRRHRQVNLPAQTKTEYTKKDKCRKTETDTH